MAGLAGVAWLAAGALGWSGAFSPVLDNDPCEPFYRALAQVPHRELTATSGRIEWLWGRERTTGCQIQFATDDSLLAGKPAPDFLADPGTVLHRLGWRTQEDFIADGPGSGIYGIRRDAVLCLIRWDQPAHVDDQGNVVGSSVFTLTLQCRETGGS